MAKLTISDAARVAGVARSTRMTARGEPVVYVIAEHAHAPLCKIGFTTNLPKRLEALRTANPMLLQVIALWRMPSTQEARRIEREILQAYAMYRQRGEWFNIVPAWLVQMIDSQRQCAALDVHEGGIHAARCPDVWLSPWDPCRPRAGGFST